MLKKLCITEFIAKKQELPLIDVRSPVEFHKGHITGAVNVALFSDEERAAIGIKYKNESQATAIDLGLDFAVPKIEHFINRANKIAPHKKVLLYCARGGMRSYSFAKLLVKANFKEVYILENGYKAFRKYALDRFDDKAEIIILGGMTGSGKTDILKQIAEHGEQVLDLEKLSCHKGSAFGWLGQGEQPTCQQFENDIFEKWHKFDFSKRIWFENESRKIGKVIIPAPLFQKILNSKLIELVVGKEIRAKRLVNEYAHFDKALLKEAVMKIKNRLGEQNAKQVLMALEKEDYKQAVQMVLVYYDKSYKHGMSKRDNDNIVYLPYDHASGVQDIISRA
ncbi:tRNA 2-selenouridine(34) synthase MnmH [Candidatus Margulisiibacteriota bacterium]